MLPFTNTNNTTDNLVFEYEGFLGFTVLQNIFIEHFMPSANGSHVKVYLAGLKRCFGHKDSQWASHRTIAQEAGNGVSISTVKRAWRYWESVGLVRVFPRFLRDVSNLQDYSFERTKVYRIPTSSLVRFTNLQELAQEIAVRQALAQAQAEVACATDIPRVSSQANRGSGHGRTEGRVMGELLIKTTEKSQRESRLDKGPQHVGQAVPFQVVSGPPSSDGTDSSPADFQTLCELYRTLTGKGSVGKADRNHLERLLQRYGLEDASDALKEASKGRGRMSNFLRYTEGILQNWSREGKRVSTEPQKTGRDPLRGGLPLGTKKSLPKGNTACHNPENAAYYAEFVKRELEMLDEEPLETIEADGAVGAAPSEDPLENIYAVAAKVLEEPLDDGTRRYLSGLFHSMGLGFSEFTELVRRAATFVRDGHRWFGAICLAGE